MQKFLAFILAFALSISLSACQKIMREPSPPLSDAASSSVSSSTLSEIERSSMDLFHKTENGDFTGTITLKGYPLREERCSKGGYGDVCAAWATYVFFKITDGMTPPLGEYMEQNKGNAFMKSDAIGLGCEQSDGLREILPILDSGNPASPVTIVLNRHFETPGMGAHACYSHFEIDSVSD
jgi:hypothetical protein